MIGRTLGHYRVESKLGEGGMGVVCWGTGAGGQTESALLTRTGTVMGTAAYMSPEQARGSPVDKRTDIWAFGCVLYELLSGKKAFGRETLSDTMVSVLSGEPDWEALPAAAPARLRELLRRCLRKDARERLHDIADARLEMEGWGDCGGFRGP